MPREMAVYFQTERHGSAGLYSQAVLMSVGSASSLRGGLTATPRTIG